MKVSVYCLWINIHKLEEKCGEVFSSIRMSGTCEHFEDQYVSYYLSPPCPLYHQCVDLPSGSYSLIEIK